MAFATALAIGYNNQKFLVIVSGLFFLILYIILIQFDSPKDDILVFFDYSQAFKEGTLFDNGGFSEYPPLAWIFILLPGLFTDSLQTYYMIYAAIDVICMFIISVVMIRVCEGRTNFLFILILIYIIITSIYARDAVMKFDIIAVMFMALSLMMFLNKKYYGSVLFAVIGGLIKLFPLMVIIVYLFMLLREKDGLIELSKGITCCIAVFCSIVIILFLTRFDMDILFGFVSFQSDRGFHIESMMGTISVVLCNLMGWPTAYVPNYHTYDIDNQICDALLNSWSVIMIVVLVVSISLIFFGCMKKQINDEKVRFKILTASVFFLLLVCLLINKVFSTQFLQWIYPLMIMFLCYRKVSDIVMFAVMYAATMLISVDFLSSSNQTLLLARDILLIVLLIFSASYVLFGRWDIIRMDCKDG